MKKIMMLTGALMMASTGAAFANEEKMETKAKWYFDKMDSNNDGMVSKAEQTAFGNQMFDKSDTNNDNMISLQETIAHKKQEKEEFKMKHGDMDDDS